mmetsp:Transcript_12502/g.44217  ORF Transcript_12502/g.44217 Transcript_12502/m.44217 type:complete len:671 (+) Transcript_12502:144-2156(+)
MDTFSAPWAEEFWAPKTPELASATPELVRPCTPEVPQLEHPDEAIAELVRPATPEVPQLHRFEAATAELVRPATPEVPLFHQLQKLQYFEGASAELAFATREVPKLALFEEKFDEEDGEESVEESVEEASDSLLRSLYTKELDMNQLIGKLRDYSQAQEGDRRFWIYLQTVNNLVDETRNFKHFPQQELDLTADFLALMVCRGLLPPAALRHILDFVLTGLRSPQDTKMWSFGSRALQQIAHRLHNPAIAELLGDLLPLPVGPAPAVEASPGGAPPLQGGQGALSAVPRMMGSQWIAPQELSSGNYILPYPFGYSPAMPRPCFGGLGSPWPPPLAQPPLGPPPSRGPASTAALAAAFLSSLAATAVVANGPKPVISLPQATMRPPGSWLPNNNGADARREREREQKLELKRWKREREQRLLLERECRERECERERERVARSAAESVMGVLLLERERAAVGAAVQALLQRASLEALAACGGRSPAGSATGALLGGALGPGPQNPSPVASRSLQPPLAKALAPGANGRPQQPSPAKAPAPEPALPPASRDGPGALLNAVARPLLVPPAALQQLTRSQLALLCSPPGVQAVPPARLPEAGSAVVALEGGKHKGRVCKGQKVNFGFIEADWSSLKFQLRPQDVRPRHSTYGGDSSIDDPEEDLEELERILAVIS